MGPNFLKLKRYYAMLKEFIKDRLKMYLRCESRVYSFLGDCASKCWEVFAASLNHWDAVCKWWRWVVGLELSGCLKKKDMKDCNFKNKSIYNENRAIKLKRDIYLRENAIVRR